MKIAVISDIHDNQERLKQALSMVKEENISTAICCGDVGTINTLLMISNTFEKVYLAFGNMDYVLKNQTSLIPENIEWSEGTLKTIIEGKNIAIVHHDYKAKDLAKLNKFDIIFYGHTHTPWEKKVGKTTILNPGEIAGQFGKASFAIFIRCVSDYRDLCN